MCTVQGIYGYLHRGQIAVGKGSGLIKPCYSSAVYKGSWHGDVAVKMLRVSQQATEEHTADLRREVAMLMYDSKDA